MAARGDVVDLLDDSSDGESDARGIPGVRWFASKSCANDLRRPLPAPLRSAAHSTHGRSNSTKELHNSTSGSARSTSDDGPSGNATTKKSGPRVYPTYDDAVKTALAMVASLDAENGRIASISDSTTSSTSNSNSHHLDPVVSAAGTTSSEPRTAAAAKSKRAAKTKAVVEKATVGVKARTRSLVKNSSSLFAKSSGHHHHHSHHHPHPVTSSSLAVDTFSIGATIRSSTTTMTAAGHRSRSKSHYHRSGKIKRSSVKTSAYHSSPYAVTRKNTSASHVPKQAGKKAPPQDLIEISSSSSSMSASDQKEESGSSEDDSSSSFSSCSSADSTPRAPKRKVRRLNDRSPRPSRLSSANSSRRREQDTVSAHRGMVRPKHKDRLSVATVTSALQHFHRRENATMQQQQRQPQPPFKQQRGFLSTKKTSRKTIILNLSTTQGSECEDDYLSSSSSSSSSGSVSSTSSLGKPRRSSSSMPRSSSSEYASKARRYCRKSAPVSTSSAAIRQRPLFSPSVPLPTPSTLKRQIPSVPSSPDSRLSKRTQRQTMTRFNVDAVALDEVQAQERELACFEMQKKQLRALGGTTAHDKRASIKKSIAPWHEVNSENRDQTQKPISDTDSDVQVIGFISGLPPKAIRKTVVRKKTQDQQSQVAMPASKLSQVPTSVQKRDESSAVEPKPRTNAQSPFFLTYDTSCHVIHPTAYHGLCVGEVPIRVLPDDATACAPPFCYERDIPLTAYDESNKLVSKCNFVASFGKSKQQFASLLAYNTKESSSQVDMDTRVKQVIDEELPRLLSCRQRKVDAILREARRKVSTYKYALLSHQRELLKHQVRTYQCELPSLEKRIANHAKEIEPLIDSNGLRATATITITRWTTHLQEEHVCRPMLSLKKVRPLSNFTTSIGVKSNVRVEDNPISRFTSSSASGGPGGSSDDARSGDDALSTKKQLRFHSAMDDEVGECVLRLVVGQMGDSEQVFRALKDVLGFSQAYADYSELKKMHDSRATTARRVTQTEALATGCRPSGVDDDALAYLRRLAASQPLILNNGISPTTLADRLSPPPSFFESHFARQHNADSTSSSTTLSSMGIRSVSGYGELSEPYRDLFCRLCYKYDCHEHGNEQPLPSRRVDPVHPAVQVSMRGGSSKHADALARQCSMFEKLVRCSKAGEWDGEPEMVDLTVANHVDAHDPTEFVDVSHVSLVARELNNVLDPSRRCSGACWKALPSHERRSFSTLAQLGPSETALVEKVRQAFGDSACTIASVVKFVSCAAIEMYLDADERGRAGSVGGASPKHNSKKHWQRNRGSNSRSSNNTELLQRARNHRLQDRRTEHQYEPCSHDGLCDSMGCSCMKRDHMCDKACSCSRECPNRYQGCRCAKGSCRTDACPCFAALRECDPDMCATCGSAEMTIAMYISGGLRPRQEAAFCCNMHVAESVHKRVGLSFSTIHGWGVFALEDIKCGEFVYEYTGAVVSQDEAERRGSIYDKRSVSFLFDLNEDAVVDAVRKGNKSKFVNHKSVGQNCSAKVVRVRGDHHITVWADQDIKCGEELLFNYGYHGDTAPEWSQVGVAGSSGSDDATCSMKT